MLYILISIQKNQVDIHCLQYALNVLLQGQFPGNVAPASRQYLGTPDIHVGPLYIHV